jgi:hypothetical protein
MKDFAARLADVPAAVAELRGLVAGEIAALEERLELVEALAERDRAIEAQAARVDLSAEGQKILKYIATNDGAFYKALRRLEAMQKPRRPGPNRGARPQPFTAPDGPADVTADVPPGDAAPGDAPAVEPAATTEPISGGSEPDTTPEPKRGAEPGAIAAPPPPEAGTAADPEAETAASTEPISSVTTPTPTGSEAVGGAVTDEPISPAAGPRLIDAGEEDESELERYGPEAAALRTLHRTIEALYGARACDEDRDRSGRCRDGELPRGGGGLDPGSGMAGAGPPGVGMPAPAGMPP